MPINWISYANPCLATWDSWGAECIRQDRRRFRTWQAVLLLIYRHNLPACMAMPMKEPKLGRLYYVVVLVVSFVLPVVGCVVCWLVLRGKHRGPARDCLIVGVFGFFVWIMYSVGLSGIDWDAGVVDRVPDFEAYDCVSEQDDLNDPDIIWVPQDGRIDTLPMVGLFHPDSGLIETQDLHRICFYS